MSADSQPIGKPFEWISGEGEEPFAKVFRQSPMILTLASLKDDRYIEVNEAFEQYTGWKHAEVIGRTPGEIGLWVDPGHRLQIKEHLLAGRAVRNVELHARMKDGKVRIGLGSAQLIEIGAEPCVLWTVAEITELKRAEESRLWHAAVLESSDDAIISEDLDGIISAWNSGAQRMFGYTDDAAVGQPITIIVPPKLRQDEVEILRRLRAGERTEHYETVRQTKDGRQLDVSVTVLPVITSAGRVIGASKIVRDITVSKRAAAALRESEERFRLVANAAPVMLWMSGTDKHCTYVNQVWQTFTGKSEAQAMGKGWTEAIHPDDIDRSMALYVEAFDKQEPLRMEYRYCRYDGVYRWLLVSGVPRFGGDGTFEGYIGTCIDVTTNKLAEEALSRVSQSLIEAQEEERTRVARELHDDIVQRTAALTYQLDGVMESLPKGKGRDQVRAVGHRLSQLCLDMQALSRRLHSPSLDLLGLVSVAGDFCAELAARHRVRIDFDSSSMPEVLPGDISLCLYRVLQEALQNAVKHSGAPSIQVTLQGGVNELRLTVRDWGKGFDLEDGIKSHGLGLTSMRERLKLVDGQISIQSKPQQGTTIDARVPILVPGILEVPSL